jgi:methyl-accepting chemotaxis protein
MQSGVAPHEFPDCIRATCKAGKVRHIGAVVGSAGAVMEHIGTVIESARAAMEHIGAEMENTRAVLGSRGAVLDNTRAVLGSIGAVLDNTRAGAGSIGVVLDSTGATMESIGAAMDDTGAAMGSIGAVLDSAGAAMEHIRAALERIAATMDNNAASNSLIAAVIPATAVQQGGLVRHRRSTARTAIAHGHRMPAIALAIVDIRQPFHLPSPYFSTAVRPVKRTAPAMPERQHACPRMVARWRQNDAMVMGRLLTLRRSSEVLRISHSTDQRRPFR